MPLRTVRDQWIDAADEVDEMETRWLRGLTVQESVSIYLDLYEGFRSQMDKTGALFLPDRQAYLAQISRRLRRLAQWQLKHGQSTAQ